MNTLLIVGIETMAGRHLAHHFSNTNANRVLGVALTEEASHSTARATLEAEKVTQVLYCGQAAASSWSNDAYPSKLCSDGSQLILWSNACGTTKTPLVFLSSDCLFDGPWMFHDEQSKSIAETPRAQSILSQEAIVLHNPQSLIIRSHLYGFSETSFLTQHLLHQTTLETIDRVEHATPLYAGTFARLLEELLVHKLSGVLHLGGGARLSKSQFAHQLAERFETPSNKTVTSQRVENREGGMIPYRETSLRSSRAKNLLSAGLPSVDNSFDEIATDLASGTAAKLGTDTQFPTSKVA